MVTLHSLEQPTSDSFCILEQTYVCLQGAHMMSTILKVMNKMNGVPGRARTCDLRIRNPLLYPTELRAQIAMIIAL